MAKGLEGIITSISKQLGVLEKNIDDIYYGSKLKNTGIKLPGSKTKVNGIKPLVEEISKFDLCNVLTYATSNLNLSTVTGANTVVSRKLAALQDKAKELAKVIDSNTLSANSLKDPSQVSKINEALQSIVGNIDSDTVAVMPQLANAKNFLDDIQGTLSAFTPATSSTGVSVQFRNLNTIPNAEVQRLLSKIRGVQSTVSSIANMKSVQDLLNIANNAGNLNVANQLKRLQQAVDPARLLPAFRDVARTLKSLNQIILKILNFVKILQVIGKVAQVLLKVLNVVAKVLSFIPIPNMVTVVTITQKFSDALQNVKKLIENGLKRVVQIKSLVELIYSFTLGVTAKIQELIRLVDIIIFNLQTCEQLSGTSGPVVAELQDGITRIGSSIGRLNAFTNSYAAATEAVATGNSIIFEGYTLSILEEEVVERGVRNKRRRAVALDSRGVLVAETQLTFATDKFTLYEELKLLLKNQGLVSDTGAVGESELAGLLAVDVTEDFVSEEDAYKSVGVESEQELVITSAAVSAEVSNFIRGIKKGGRKFRRRVRQITAKFASSSAQALKQTAKSGNFKPSSPINKFAGSFGRTAKVSQGAAERDRPSPDLLTPAQRTRWQTVASSPITSKALRAKARNILEKDREAQEGE